MTNACIIITFVDFKYLEIFNIFYEYFEKLNLDLLVISLDEETFENLKMRQIKTVYIEYKIDSKKQFWEFRLSIINKIFKKTKRSIIHTDSDCFWFKNILEYIKLYENEYDIIGSIAFGLPQNIVKKIGFVLCCGFYFIKYTEKNSSIIDNIIKLKDDLNTVDDQILFNYYIYNNIENIVETQTNPLIYKKIVLRDYTTVGIIKDNIISRKYEKDLYCFHPLLSSKEISGKLEQIHIIL
jgi:hypothetical protein